jgi:hypothetical protein
MKKLFLIVFLFCCFSVNAQTPISLNFSDLGVPVRSYDIRIDSAVIPGILPGNAGPNQTWNFIGLHSTLDTLQLNLTYNYYGVLYNNFPLANVAYHADSKLNYNYYNSSAAGLLHYGIVSDYLGTGDSIKVVFSQPDTILKLPANYPADYSSIVLGDSKSRCHYSFDTVFMSTPVTVPIDTLRIKHTQFHVATIDAWGTMTTPTDVFPALRQKNVVETVDSIWGYANVPVPFQSYSGWYMITILSDTSQSFKWWMNGLGIPAVEMFMNKLSDTQVVKTRWVRDVFAGVNENDYYNSGVYPNPANDFIKISTSGEFSEVRVYDMLGNEVIRQKIQNNNELTVSTANIPDGMYFYNLVGPSGKTTGKFVVIH